eukprot:403372701
MIKSNTRQLALLATLSLLSLTIAAQTYPSYNMTSCTTNRTDAYCVTTTGLVNQCCAQIVQTNRSAPATTAGSTSFYCLPFDLARSFGVVDVQTNVSVNISCHINSLSNNVSYTCGSNRDCASDSCCTDRIVQVNGVTKSFANGACINRNYTDSNGISGFNFQYRNTTAPIILQTLNYARICQSSSSVVLGSLMSFMGLFGLAIFNIAF